MENEFQVILEKMMLIFEQKNQKIRELQDRLDNAEREIVRLISEKNEKIE